MVSLFACRKSDLTSNRTTAPPYTPVPKYSTINTEMGVYVYNNAQNNKPVYVYGYTKGRAALLEYNGGFDGFFSSGPMALDPYFSTFTYTTTNGFYDPQLPRQKTVTLSAARKNYVGVNYKTFTGIGEVRNLAGPVTLSLPGGGSLAFSDTAFDSYGTDMRYQFYATYNTPTLTDYVLNLPAAPYADDKNRRWFLDSYGVYELARKLGYCNCNVIREGVRFNNDVLLRIPIPPERLANAPDSIEAWFINGFYQWEKEGFAHRAGHFYEKKTRMITAAWNVARPLDGVYLNVQLRTTNDIAIPNTRYLIKSGNDEIAEGRTDADGNALVLVPVDRPLSFGILNDHFYNYANLSSPEQNLGSFSRAGDVKVTLPDRLDIGTLEASVYKCDGSSFGNGYVVIAQKDARDAYHVPIRDGRFAAAGWLGMNSATKLSFYDAGGTLSFENNTYLSGIYNRHLKRLNENFYACTDAGQLYCNYTIDGVPYSINGSMSKETPALVLQRHQHYSEMIIRDGTKGIHLETWLEGNSVGTPLQVNNVSYKLDQYGASEIRVYRNDAVVNGFVEGWFAVDYLDAGSKPHTVMGNFRLKII
jgi:hypothetical protein